jgi:hypothetical protein
VRDWCSAIGTKDDVSGAVRRTSIFGDWRSLTNSDAGRGREDEVRRGEMSCAG